MFLSVCESSRTRGASVFVMAAAGTKGQQARELALPSAVQRLEKRGDTLSVSSGHQWREARES